MAEKTKIDIVLAGVGGQGVLSVAAVVSMAAMKEGLNVRQSEVHGMAQRGGAVQAHMRISSGEVPGDLIPKGGADVILSMEPMEALRYLDYLKPDGVVVTAAEPMVNIPNYPDVESLLAEIRKNPANKVVEAKKLAQEAGSARSVNMVLVGAVCSTLPIPSEAVENAMTERFASKGEKIVTVNKKAFNLGLGV